MRPNNIEAQNFAWHRVRDALRIVEELKSGRLGRQRREEAYEDLLTNLKTAHMALTDIAENLDSSYLAGTPRGPLCLTEVKTIAFYTAQVTWEDACHQPE